MKNTQEITFFNSKEEIKMRVTIDLDRDIIIIPDNFFKKIGEENVKRNAKEENLNEYKAIGG